MATLLKNANFSNNSNFQGLILYDSAIYDPVKDQYTVIFRLQARSINGWSGGGSPGSGSINGTQVGTFSTIGVNTTLNIGTLTVQVPVDSQGKSSVNYTASITTPWTIGSVSLSGTLPLPNIAKASSITATDANIGSATTININRANSAFKHTLRYSFGSLNGTIASNIDISYGWQIPSSFYAQIPNASQGTVTLYCDTYDGAKLMGTTQATFKINVDSISNAPDISAIIQDMNTVASSLTGSPQKLIRFMSNVKVNVTATAKNSATISNITISNSGVSQNGNQVTFNNAISGVFVITVTDSRGISKNLTQTLSMIDYILLSLNPTLYRPQPTTGEVKIRYSGNYFNGGFGSTSNSLTLKYRYRKTTESSWGSYINLTPSISSNAFSNGSADISLGTGFNYQSNYIFEFVISDKVDSKIISGDNTFVKRGQNNHQWGKNNFKHNTPVYDMNNNRILSINDIFPIGRGFIDYTNTDYSNYLGFTWERECIGMVPVGLDPSQEEFNTIGKTGGEKKHKLTIEEMPSHSHNVYGGNTTTSLPIGNASNANNGWIPYINQSQQYTNANTITNTGDGVSHNNIQPYKVVNFWKRVA